MKYLFSLLLCFTFLLSQAQTEPQNTPKQMPDFDELDFEGLNLDQLDLSELDLDKVFGMLDSLPIDLNNLGNFNQLFSEQFGDLSENKDLLNDLIQQGMKTFEQMDMTELEGLMQNFMKDLEGLNLDDMIDADEMEKIIDKHAKKRKI